MTIKNAKKILVAPLDWGLGHTTRCVPIIQYIIELGHEVLFAGNQSQRDYIKASFPHINAIHLEGYNVHYSTSATTFMLTIAKQVPAILQAVKSEHQWLKEVVEQHKIDAVISDNRYGLHHANIPCVIMTHQLQILTGRGRLIDNIMRDLHKLKLKKFNQCWVVDVAEGQGLAGKLSHPRVIPNNARYIGLLSQLTPASHPNDGYILILLSGPEPQRTILSDILWQQALDYSGRIVFVEGSSSVEKRKKIPSHIAYHTQLVHSQLHNAIGCADLVISRSGYSTIMDLVKLNKRAILIPTPGQTEQEYLGKSLEQQNLFSHVPQKGFDLQREITISASQSDKSSFEHSFSLFKQVINDWLN